MGRKCFPTLTGGTKRWSTGHVVWQAVPNAKSSAKMGEGRFVHLEL